MGGGKTNERTAGKETRDELPVVSLLKHHPKGKKNEIKSTTDREARRAVHITWESETRGARREAKPAEKGRLFVLSVWHLLQTDSRPIWPGPGTLGPIRQDKPWFGGLAHLRTRNLWPCQAVSFWNSHSGCAFVSSKGGQLAAIRPRRRRRAPDQELAFRVHDRSSKSERSGS